MRFGRGISPEGSPLAARQAADLMRWYCGGTVAEGIADSYPTKQEAVTLDIDNHEAERILGDLFRIYREDPRKLPAHVVARFDEEGEARAVGDYIAGMTDRFALAEHRRLLDSDELL